MLAKGAKNRVYCLHRESPIKLTLKIEGKFYLVSIEKGNNQIGIITLWKKKQ
jgi:hypothetical protein